MKKLLGLAAALALGLISATADIGSAQDPIGDCHRVYATPPGGGEPMEVEACP